MSQQTAEASSFPLDCPEYVALQQQIQQVLGDIDRRTPRMGRIYKEDIVAEFRGRGIQVTDAMVNFLITSLPLVNGQQIVGGFRIKTELDAMRMGKDYFTR